MRPTLVWLLAFPALLGLAAFLSFWGMVAAVRFADIEVRHSLDPEPGGMPETWFWAWVTAGWLGLIMFLLFGALAVGASTLSRRQAHAPDTTGNRHGDTKV
jgi:hypothetical protein